jgi:hypothetical protein
MAYPQTLIPYSDANPRRGLLYAIITFWGLVAVCLLTIFVGEIGMGDKTSKYYLLPWCVATGVVTAAPSVYLFYKGRFDPFHPLVFPAWSYFFPGFFIGGLVVAAGLSQPYFLSYIQDETYNFPLTFAYVMLGYGGLTLGYALPYGKRVGNWLGSWFPKWDIPTQKISTPALILLALGLANTILAFGLGILGFQKVEQIGAFDGIIFLLSLFWIEATFLLWLYIFRCDRFGLWQILIVGLLLVTALTRSAFQGNRGGLIQLIVLIAFAYCFSGRKLTGKHYAIGSVLVVLGLIGGMIYGTTFRAVKENQEQVSMDQYATLVSNTFDKLSDQDPGTILANGFGALAERIDAVSSLAVVVSNYEALAPYEEAWGINNNIYVDTVTFFIPRVIWPDKPVSIEPSKYADLYFNFSENSFTITPMGDLLRNFGPIGVPLGMIVLGFILRVLYASLIEGWTFQFWRATLFYMIFTNAISFEGVYSLIIPLIVKVGLVAFFGLLIVRFIAGGSRKPAQT